VLPSASIQMGEFGKGISPLQAVASSVEMPSSGLSPQPAISQGVPYAKLMRSARDQKGKNTKLEQDFQKFMDQEENRVDNLDISWGRKRAYRKL
ncbi:MAG: hypothetical protein AAB588_05860, partial [Patescibacteria group bacterium]